jgi:hypothetical protein
LKIKIPEELNKKIKKHPEIDWDSIASKAFRTYLEYLHDEPIQNDKLEKLAEFSLKEFLENEPEIYTDQDLIKRY